jgi:hypothetical protein
MRGSLRHNPNVVTVTHDREPNWKPLSVDSASLAPISSVSDRGDDTKELAVRMFYGCGDALVGRGRSGDGEVKGLWWGGGGKAAARDPHRRWWGEDGDGMGCSGIGRTVGD